MKFKISSPQGIVDVLKKAMAGINSGVESELDKKMREVSRQAFEKAKELAAQRLFRTRQEYIDNLSMYKAGPNVYVIRLEADAAHLEEGYGRFDMKPGLLQLNKGTDALLAHNLSKGADANGKRGGIKTSKQGYRYRTIPFEQSGAPAKSNHPLHNTIMQQDRTPDPILGDPGRSGMETKMGDFASQFNALKKAGNKAASNLPTSFKGRAWTIEAHPANNQWATVRIGDGTTQKVVMGQQIHPNLIGLTNVRAPHENGGNKVRSAYLTFRTVSENPTQQGKWWHPGFEGAKILPDVQKWTEDTFANIAEAVFKRSA